eukprot:1161097-Pelagomonas_calceolata.AAC.1
MVNALSRQDPPDKEHTVLPRVNNMIKCDPYKASVLKWCLRGSGSMKREKEKLHTVKTLPVSIEENRVPRAEAPYILCTVQKKEANGKQEPP